ncbi:WUSCHEL-related homeobox 11-like [Musa acuminata AAA Group]|uniref:WUSCHEL-related homeobox 11 n=1 Tax=Musa acuminata AAA Group TaxID=214697 RepID=UPI0031D1F365
MKNTLVQSISSTDCPRPIYNSPHVCTCKPLPFPHGNPSIDFVLLPHHSNYPPATSTMGDHGRDRNSSSTLDRSTADRTETEPVRTRWMPKPEQILILESIFNSGMVNPPKEETVRIRKLLQKFGAVGDANVFYWFQNRRSRSRRRQRQLQASLMADPRAVPGVTQQAGGGVLPHEPPTSSSSSSTSSNNSSFPCSSSASSSPSSYNFVMDDGSDDLFSMISSQTPFMCSSHVPRSHRQPGTITVFIDGVPSEVPRGPIDMRAMFGQNVMLVHSSGELLPVNEHGVVVQSLQMGESYFLVIRPT